MRDYRVTGVQTCALPIRSEEHTSELQSHDNLVCRLLLKSEEHTPELQSHDHLVCRLLIEKSRPCPVRASAPGRPLSYSTRARAPPRLPVRLLFSFLMERRPPRSALFPYPPPFRSDNLVCRLLL